MNSARWRGFICSSKGVEAHRIEFWQNGKMGVTRDWEGGLGGVFGVRVSRDSRDWGNGVRQRFP